ncbi:MAG: glycosyltransferase family 39 protein [Candidatus Pacebacteria bacterium]|nr:glycosyltransferase family 39 protein [Candidatus Paceibacterota bacterium]
MNNRKIFPIILLIIILFIAGFFRFFDLDSIPLGLYPDVAINGNDALDTLQSKNFKVFYPENNGREGLFFWVVALSFYIFGPSIWAIKFTAAVFGFFTILGIYLLAKEISKTLNYDNFKSDLISLFSTFFAAISFWHTLFSRLGFRAIMVPFFIVFGFYFLFKGLNKKDRNYILFIISGFFFGLGFYSYISYRFVVMIGIIVLIPWLIIYKKNNELKSFATAVLLLFLAVIIFALPIGIYFLENPEDFFGRAAGVSVLQSENPIKESVKSFISHLAMFNFYGDANWRHNYSGSPMLLWPVGILFLLGIIISLIRVFTSLKVKDYYSFSVFIFLTAWFFIMLLPGFLSSEGIPHSLRVIGVIPVVFIFSGFGAEFIYAKIKKYYRKPLFLNLFIIAVCLSLIWIEFYKYFYSWANNPEVSYAYSEDLFEIGAYINTLDDEAEIYVIVNYDGVRVPYPDGVPMPAQTPMFIERTKFLKTRAVYITPDEINKIEIENNGYVIPLHQDKELENKLIDIFKDLTIEKYNKFVVYKINN